MDQFYSVLSSWWKGDPYDALTMNIISALPLEIAIVILRLLDPRSLCAAMLVNRSWLGLIRSDSVLRARVHAELLRQRRAYWALIDGTVGAGRMPNAVLDAAYYRHLHHRRPEVSTRRTLTKTTERVNVPEQPSNTVLQGAPRLEAPHRPPFVETSSFVAPLASSTPTPGAHAQRHHARKQHALKAAKHRPSAKLREKLIDRRPSCLRI